MTEPVLGRSSCNRGVAALSSCTGPRSWTCRKAGPTRSLRGRNLAFHQHLCARRTGAGSRRSHGEASRSSLLHHRRRGAAAPGRGWVASAPANVTFTGFLDTSTASTSDSCVLWTPRSCLTPRPRASNWQGARRSRSSASRSSRRTLAYLRALFAWGAVFAKPPPREHPGRDRPHGERLAARSREVRTRCACGARVARSGTSRLALLDDTRRRGAPEAHGSAGVRPDRRTIHRISGGAETNVFITGGAGFMERTSPSTTCAGREITSRSSTTSRAPARSAISTGLAAARARSASPFVAAETCRTARRAPPAAITSEVDVVFHLAAQVAVTSSVTDPRDDFEVNALGTFNVLEARRRRRTRSCCTRRRTRSMAGWRRQHRRGATRYRIATFRSASRIKPLDFHSPYGCSKGAGDQYCGITRASTACEPSCCASRAFTATASSGSRTRVGSRGSAICARLSASPITIYGDGKQVRDVWFIDDLIDAYRRAVRHIDQAAWQGLQHRRRPEQTALDLARVRSAARATVRAPTTVRLADWRPGDQPVYVSDIRKATPRSGWQPRCRSSMASSVSGRWVDATRSCSRTSTHREAVVAGCAVGAGRFVAHLPTGRASPHDSGNRLPGIPGTRSSSSRCAHTSKKSACGSTFPSASL